MLYMYMYLCILFINKNSWVLKKGFYLHIHVPGTHIIFHLVNLPIILICGIHVHVYMSLGGPETGHGTE